MAIQFRCPGCQQPIEVDDVYAGQTAACPYCHRVVTVPTESSLDAAPVEARPGGAPGPAGSQPPSRPAEESYITPPPPMPPDLDTGRLPSPRELRARNFGTYALVCTVIAVGLIVVTLIYGVKLGMKSGLASRTAQPTQQQMEAFQKEINQNPWVRGASIGGLFFACAGLALGITSLVQSARGNWRGMVSTIACGLFVLCTCGGTALSVAGGVGASAAPPG